MPSCCDHTQRKSIESSLECGVSFIRALIPFMRPHPHDLSVSLVLYLPILSHWALGFQHVNSEGDTHSDNRLVDHGIHRGARAEGWWKWGHQSSSLVAGSEQTTSLPASFIYSFVHLFIFYLFLAMPCGMWDLSSPTRDWTHALCSGSTDLKKIFFKQEKEWFFITSSK